MIAGSGWFRIATLKTNGNGSSACTIKLSRTYNHGSPEYQEIKLFKAYNTYKFVAINAFSLQNYWTQIRLVKCEDEKYYVDIYNSNPQGPSTGQNEWEVLVENDSMMYPWEAMEAELVNSSDGELIASLNLPANFCNGNGEQIPVVGKTGYIAYPNDAYYQVTSNSVTGYIGIVLPVSWTNTFLRFTVSIFNMGTGESCDYHISGYNYASTSTWSNCTAVCVGKADSVHSNLPVRFGHNGTKCIICIGETSTNWIYPVVQVHDVVLGYNSRDFDTWKSGWNIHFYTGLPGTVNFLIPTTHVANGGVAGSCTGNAATATRATQDGDGNNIVNTYQKKKWSLIGKAEIRGGTFSFSNNNLDQWKEILVVISDNGSSSTYFDTHYIPYDVFADTLPSNGEMIYDLDVGVGDTVKIEFIRGNFIIHNSTYNKEVRIYGKK